MMKRLSLLCFVALVAFVGCSGGYSFTGASIPPEAKTISVANFPNYASTVNPQLSQKLSDELRNMFSSQTSLNVVNGDADMEISGQITAYTNRASTISAGDEASMYRLSITIKVKFVNNVDPDASFDQQFTRFRDYNAQQNFSAVENSLMGEIVTELCEDVFNKSVVNW
mgnify:CR=1 FL=1